MLNVKKKCIIIYFQCKGRKEDNFGCIRNLQIFIKKSRHIESTKYICKSNKGKHIYRRKYILPVNIRH